MKIKKGKKIKEFEEVFPDLESFKNYILKSDKNIRYDNEEIKKEIEKLMLKLKCENGFISYSLIKKWLIKNYSFKNKKWSSLNYFVERGWSEADALIELKKRNKEVKKRNRLCEEYWIKKGFSKNEALEKISESQKNSAKCVKVFHGKSKKMLREKGYTEEEIYNICLTPTNIKFWMNKGFSEKDAKQKVIDNQKNAVKFVDFDKRLLPSNFEYWVKKGFSEEEAKKKVSENQITFSLEKCIKKYGEEQGKIRFTERQKKWMDSLNNNGNMKIGYSKISQELFYKLLYYYNVVDRDKIFFGSHNKEYKLKKEGGGLWVYDFTDLLNKKIIEYNGDDYHGNPIKYKSDDFTHPFNKNITYEHIWEID